MSESKYKITLFSGVYTTGWLFTIGFLKLSFWKAVLALLIWAWYLGRSLGGF